MPFLQLLDAGGSWREFRAISRFPVKGLTLTGGDPLLMHAQDAFRLVARYLSPPPVVAVLSGPSGVGKDSVIRRMSELGYAFEFVVTATDRPPRPGERHGIDYYFVTRSEFERLISENEFFEYALVYGQYKGVPKFQVREALKSGRDVIMRLDVQGAATIRRQVPQVLTVFLAPPSPDVLLSRLRRRGGDSEEQLQKRLDVALSEMRRIYEFDYVVVNYENKLDDAAHQVAAIMQAEKLRSDRTAIAV